MRRDDGARGARRDAAMPSTRRVARGKICLHRPRRARDTNDGDVSVVKIWAEVVVVRMAGEARGRGPRTTDGRDGTIRDVFVERRIRIMKTIVKRRSKSCGGPRRGDVERRIRIMKTIVKRRSKSCGGPRVGRTRERRRGDSLSMRKATTAFSKRMRRRVRSEPVSRRRRRAPRPR